MTDLDQDDEIGLLLLDGNDSVEAVGLIHQHLSCVVLRDAIARPRAIKIVNVASHQRAHSSAKFPAQKRFGQQMKEMKLTHFFGNAALKCDSRFCIL